MGLTQVFIKKEYFAKHPSKGIPQAQKSKVISKRDTSTFKNHF